MTSNPGDLAPHDPDPPSDAPMAGLTQIDESRPPIRSERAARVARWFGVEQLLSPSSSSRKTDPDRAERRGRQQRFLRDLGYAALRPGRVTLVTGPSGAGKSSLLRQLRYEYGKSITWTDLGALTLPNKPLVDCFGPRTKLPDVLMQLSCVGLGEAWSYLKTPRELSEGQRWRLRLALGLHEAAKGISDFGWRNADWKNAPDEAEDEEEDVTLDDSLNPKSEIQNPKSTETAPAVIVCDEFAAVLDRVTACVVSRALRRSIDHLPNLCAIVATSHDDLIDALSPDTIVRCDFGRVTIESG